MSWNFNIASAPRGRMVERSVNTNDGVRMIPAFEEDHVILESKCGKVIKSYWIEKEARWAGFAKNEQPIAWQPWPEPSGRRSDLGHEVTNLPIIEDCGSGA